MPNVLDSVVAVSQLQHVPQPAPFPSNGRTFEARRRVRLGDVTPKGRLRLDAIARYLQDIATDDALDGDYDDPHGWVVRRTEMWVHRFPKYLDHLRLTTWCGGVGSHWAERRTRLSFMDDTAMPDDTTSLGNPTTIAVEAAAMWVRVDLRTLKPLALTERFRSLIGESANGRKVSARLTVGRGLPEPETANFEQPLRFSDFDAVGHLNNAVYWEPVEEYLGAHRERRAPLYAVVEHHRSVEPGATLGVAVYELPDRVVLRLRDAVETAAFAQVSSD